jgi:hypothetical protein
MNLGTTLPNVGTETLTTPAVNANVVGKGTIQNRGQVNAASMIPQFGGGNIPFNQLTTQQKLDILFGKG